MCACIHNGECGWMKGIFNGVGEGILEPRVLRSNCVISQPVAGWLGGGAGVGGAASLTRGKSIFQRKKLCCLWTLTVQFEAYIFSL